MNEIEQIHNTNENAKKVNVVQLQTITPKYNIFRSILITFGVCFVIVMFVFQILLTPIAIDGISMQPTLNVEYSPITAADKQDIVYYSKTDNYSRGDIVIVNNKKDDDTIIKRVIAIGGDTITLEVFGEPTYVTYNKEKQINRMSLAIKINNGDKLNENYIKEDMYFQFITSYNSYDYQNFEFYKNIDSELKTNQSFSITLPDNTYFCMGDNRNNSYDSRHYGYFGKEDILGEQILHVPYGKSIFYALWHKIFG